MLLTCAVRSIADLLKPRGKSPPKLKLADVPAYVKDELGLHGMTLSADMLVGSTRERLAALRDRADKARCACLMLMEESPLDLASQADATADAAVDRLRRIVEAASLLGCNAAGIRLHPAEGEPARDRAVTRLRAVMERAEKLEINVLINPAEGFTKKPEGVTDFIKRVGGFRVGSLPDFKAASDADDPAVYLKRITPYASVVLASTFEFGEPPEKEPDPDKPGSLDDLAEMLLAAEAPPHLTYDLDPLVKAVAAVGFDGTLAIDYRGAGDGTLGVLHSREALEAAIQAATEA